MSQSDSECAYEFMDMSGEILYKPQSADTDQHFPAVLTSIKDAGRTLIQLLIEIFICKPFTTRSIKTPLIKIKNVRAGNVKK